MKYMGVILLALLSAGYSRADVTPANQITHIEVAYGCNGTTPDMTSWTMNTYTSSSFALRFSSQFDGNQSFYISNRDVYAVYTPTRNDWPTQIRKIGEVTGDVSCAPTGNGEPIEPSWNTVVLDAGVSLSLVGTEDYTCRTDDRAELKSTGNTGLSVTRDGSSFSIHPNECQP